MDAVSINKEDHWHFKALVLSRCRMTDSRIITLVTLFLSSASGCPGSHVVIRCHDQNLNDDVVMDAAALAARQSKCNGSVIKVSMCRARDVKKPPGAKAGLVQLTGQIRTVSVNMKEAQARLDRLDETVLVN